MVRESPPAHRLESLVPSLGRVRSGFIDVSLGEGFEASKGSPHCVSLVIVGQSVSSQLLLSVSMDSVAL